MEKENINLYRKTNRRVRPSLDPPLFLAGAALPGLRIGQMPRITELLLLFAYYSHSRRKKNPERDLLLTTDRAPRLELENPFFLHQMGSEQVKKGEGRAAVEYGWNPL